MSCGVAHSNLPAAGSGCGFQGTRASALTVSPGALQHSPDWPSTGGGGVSPSPQAQIPPTRGARCPWCSPVQAGRGPVPPARCWGVLEDAGVREKQPLGLACKTLAKLETMLQVSLEPVWPVAATGGTCSSGRKQNYSWAGSRAGAEGAGHRLVSAAGGGSCSAGASRAAVTLKCAMKITVSRILTLVVPGSVSSTECSVWLNRAQRKRSPPQHAGLCGDGQAGPRQHVAALELLI